MLAHPCHLLFFIGLALTALVLPPAAGQQYQRTYSACMSSCTGEKNECSIYCTCTISTLEEQLTLDERVAITIDPTNPRWLPVIEKSQNICLQKTKSRLEADKKAQEKEIQIATQFCQSEDAVTAPLMAVNPLPGVKAVYLLDFLPRDVDASLAARFGFRSPTGFYIERPGAPNPLRQGDIVLRVNNKVVTGASNLLDFVGPMAPGTKLSVCGIRQSDVVGLPATEFRTVITLKDPFARNTPNPTAAQDAAKARNQFEMTEYCSLKTSVLYIQKKFIPPAGKDLMTALLDKQKECKDEGKIDAAEYSAYKAARNRILNGNYP